MAHRMRIEGGDDDRPALVRAALHGAADHRLVAEVKAVEIAERDDRAAKGVGDRLVEGQALHGRRGLARTALGNAGRLRLTRPLANPTWPLIPFHRFPAAHSCARRFFVWNAG